MTDHEVPTGAASDTDPPDRTRVRPRRSSLRRRFLVGVGVVGLALIAALAWLAFTGLKARSELQAVRAQVRTLRAEISAGDLAGARSTARSLTSHAHRADELTSGPVWATAAAIPHLGDPLSTIRTVTSNVDAIAANALPPLVDAISRLDPQQLRRADGSFDLAPIAAVSGPLDRAARTMRAALSHIAESSGSTWLGSVDAARVDVLGQLGKLTRSVQAAHVAALALPPMLGADGPKSYMVTFQNEAELRGLGGLPGAFAILKADHGRVTFTRFEPDSTLNGVSSGLDLGKQFDALWPSARATKLYVNSTVSPHFPYAARIWRAMWQKKSGQRLDGAIVLDPTTLSYLLAVTGPAVLSDGTQVSAANVVELTQRTVYSRFATNNDARKQYLLHIARAVSQKLIKGKPNATALVRAAGRAVGEHRLLVWTRDTRVESELATTSISGVIPETSAPYVGLAIINSGGNKLDYYLHASLDWRRTGCGPTREVTVTIRLVNDAPSSGLPAYVLGFTGHEGFPQTPGVNRATIMYYASVGAILQSVSRNGTRVFGTLGGVERAHTVVARGIDIPLRTPQTFVLHLQEPAGSGAPVVRAQPMVHPVAVTVHDDSCRS